MKFNFSEVVVQDLQGIESTDLHKRLWEILYYKAKTLDLADKGKEIYNWEEVELTGEQVKEIKEAILWGDSPFFTFAKKALIDYMETIELESKKKK